MPNEKIKKEKKQKSKITFLTNNQLNHLFKDVNFINQNTHSSYDKVVFLYNPLTVKVPEFLKFELIQERNTSLYVLKNKAIDYNFAHRLNEKIKGFHNLFSYDRKTRLIITAAKMNLLKTEYPNLFRDPTNSKKESEQSSHHLFDNVCQEDEALKELGAFMQTQQAAENLTQDIDPEERPSKFQKRS